MHAVGAGLILNIGDIRRKFLNGPGDRTETRPIPFGNGACNGERGAVNGVGWIALCRLRREDLDLRLLGGEPPGDRIRIIANAALPGREFTRDDQNAHG